MRKLKPLLARQEQLHEEANDLLDELHSYTGPFVWSESAELDKRLAQIIRTTGILRFKLKELQSIEAAIENRPES